MLTYNRFFMLHNILLIKTDLYLESYHSTTIKLHIMHNDIRQLISSAIKDRYATLTTYKCNINIFLTFTNNRVNLSVDVSSYDTR